MSAPRLPISLTWTSRGEKTDTHTHIHTGRNVGLTGEKYFGNASITGFSRAQPCTIDTALEVDVRGKNTKNKLLSDFFR